MAPPRRVAVVGAGMAGLACARQLHRGGAEVTVFDKGRRPGGRLATRRADGLLFDHGAPHATARTPAFQDLLRELGPTVVPWGGEHGDPCWVGVPGMSALAQAVMDGGIGDVRLGRHVAFLHHGAGKGSAGMGSADEWHVRHRDAAATASGLVSAEGGEVAGPFDAVVVAMPAPQALGLLAAMGHTLAAPLAKVGMAPCWTLMAAFAGSHPGPDTQAAHAGPLERITRDSARPGRPALPECWVAHANADWSRAHLELPPDAVLPLLLAEFAGRTGIGGTPVHAAVHRWRYAKVEAPLGQPCLAGRDGLVLCGDWCLGPHVEAAFASGSAAAAVAAYEAVHRMPKV